MELAELRRLLEEAEPREMANGVLDFDQDASCRLVDAAIDVLPALLAVAEAAEALLDGAGDYSDEPDYAEALVGAGDYNSLAAALAALKETE